MCARGDLVEVRGSGIKGLVITVLDAWCLVLLSTLADGGSDPAEQASATGAPLRFPRFECVPRDGLTVLRRSVSPDLASRMHQQLQVLGETQSRIEDAIREQKNP